MSLCMLCGDESQPTLDDLCPECTTAVFWNSRGYDKPMKKREIVKLKRHKTAHPDETALCDRAIASIRHSMTRKRRNRQLK